METAEQAGSFVDRLLEIIPSNPVAALSDGQVLPTIFFSIMIGIGILFVGKPADPIRHFFDSAAEVVMRITMMVMELAPYGVCALMAWVMATKGIEVLSNLLWLAIALYAACIFQIIFVYGFMIIRLFLGLPLKQFFRGIADAQGVAFSTASSSATLPVTISCAETNLGVDKSVAGSVLPLGATINMDGTAIYLGLVALFAAQANGLDLSMSQYVMVAMTATLVSIGAAGIPSAGLLLAATVLNVIGISPEQSLLVIAFIFPFDRLLDMMRTLTNVSGDIAVACTVAKWEGELNEDVFRNEAEV
jgi:Na+/H+-dicarboxylate symporter